MPMKNWATKRNMKKLKVALKWLGNMLILLFRLQGYSNNHLQLDPKHKQSIMVELSAIKNSLLKLYPFSEQELEAFVAKLKYTTLQKKALLIQEKEIANSLVFLINGSLRLYTRTEQGELTITFFTENQWVTDIESLLSQQPSKNCIEAFEPSSIALITLKDIHQLMDSHPNFRMLNAILVNLTIPTTYLTTLHTKSPDQRYSHLLAEHPDWLNRFPQRHIASYLGMTPETLSRVRARIA